MVQSVRIYIFVNLVQLGYWLYSQLHPSIKNSSFRSEYDFPVETKVDCLDVPSHLNKLNIINFSHVLSVYFELQLV